MLGIHAMRLTDGGEWFRIGGLVTKDYDQRSGGNVPFDERKHEQPSQEDQREDCDQESRI